VFSWEKSTTGDKDNGEKQESEMIFFGSPESVSPQAPEQGIDRRGSRSHQRAGSDLIPPGRLARNAEND
jgi:hypothetical protein